MKSRHHPFLILLTSAVAAALVSSCSKPAPTGANSSERPGKRVVQTTNYPVTYFAQRIAGNYVDIQFQVSPGKDPAFWQPLAPEIAAFQSADLILLNGATYEKWLDRVSLPGHLLADTSAGFAPNFIQGKEAVTHSHGKQGAHSHTGTAFTTWIDFHQAKQQAEAARAALVRLVPAGTEDMNRNASALFADLDKLDADLQSVAKSIGEQPLVASHPVYQYLARRYQLRIESVLWEPEIVPDDAALQRLKEILATHPAKWMIWEGTPAAESVVKLEGLGIKSVVFDPCGNRLETGDWLSVMTQDVENLRAIH